MARTDAIIKTFDAMGVQTILRYPRAEDVDQFIHMHLTMVQEKVMCRRLTLSHKEGERMLTDILNELQNNESSYILVEQDGKIVGEGFTNKTGFNYCTVGLALINRVRGMGIGTQLMWTLEEESRRLGAKRLHLSVWGSNPSAIHVYEKVGYETCGSRPGWIQMDDGHLCDLIEMIKILSVK